ncbi:MAG: putative PIN and TRAM-domain containing protein YacL [Chlamydiae bacterium]|nr:putative PIN and TRAM-domain containing protein YacL [Chlamydiota bacterium]
MKISLAYLRVFFVLISLFFMTAFMTSLPIGPMWQKIFMGVGVGVLFSALLLSIETLFKRYNLKAFNTVILGLFLGYLLGQALTNIFNAIAEMSHMNMVLQPQTIHLIKVSFFLLGTYLGTFLTLHFTDEILISIPFIKFSQSHLRKKDLLIDATALSDSRIIDLATTGLVNNSLIIPRFLVQDLYSKAELGDENTRMSAKRCIDTLKKLEAIPSLCLRYDETKFSDENETFSKLLRLARLTDSNILSADLSQAQIPAVEGILLINLHAISNALKPLMQAGETMKIKIQRFGKEPNQGVGYLEDGTMVVVNGGGDFVGETIGVHVLSVKHTSSGRMIFCNTMDEEEVPARDNRVEV